jgi:serine/threonine-protein kinase
MLHNHRLSELLLRWEDLRAQGRQINAEELCRDCPDQLTAVAERLAALEAVYRILDTATNASGTIESATRATDLTGDTGHGHSVPAVPGFEILEELGRGGMGVVYKARQIKLNRLVALKMVLAGGFAGAEERGRFRREAEAVAGLQHPHVVQIYEVGEVDGNPFFSLEFVDGGSLDQKINGTPLPARPAAALLETLAQAVDAAHQKGIIHRDLKPANVLLTADGLPKIADFGLAKRFDTERAARGEPGAHGQPLASATGAKTQSGAILGTPSYMAPEQAGGQGKAVGPEADIYALGAILYELLTGRPPFKGATPLDTIQQVLGDEPVPPARLNPAVPRDLETICLKCLQKEVRKRYASARALAEDLGRWQAGEPIVARAVGRLERTAKWVRRNKALAAFLATLVAATLGLGLLAGLVALQYADLADANRRERDQNVKLAEANRRERDQNVQLAEANRRERDQNARLAKANRREKEAGQLARRTIEDMTSPGALAFLETQPQLRPEQRRFLEQAVAYYRQAVAMAAEDKETRVRRAQAYTNMGHLQSRLGLKEAGSSFREAIKAYQQLVAEQPQVAQYRQELAIRHTNLGTVLAALGKRTEAEAQYLAALKVQARLVTEDPQNAHYRQDLAGSHNCLGALLAELGRREEAQGQFRTALREQERLAADHPRVAAYRESLARSYYNFSLLLADQGKLQEAEAECRAALREQAGLVAEHPHATTYRRDLAQSQDVLGTLLADLGKRQEAETAFRAAIKELAQLAARHPQVPRYRQSLAGCYHNLASVLGALGRHKEAELQFRATLREFARLAAEHPQVPQYRQEMARNHNNRGNLLRNLGRPSEAAAAYRAAISEQSRLAADHPQVPVYRQDLATSQKNLAHLLADLGKRTEAEAAHRAAIKELSRLANENTHVAEYRQQLADSQNELGLLLAESGKPKEAEMEYRAALKERTRLAQNYPRVPAYAVSLGGSYCNLGNLLRDEGQLAQALPSYDKAIAILQNALRVLGTDGTARQFLRNAHCGRAETLGRLGRSGEAGQDWDRVLSLSSGPEKDFFRLKMAYNLTLSGEHVRATAIAEEMLKKYGNNPHLLYRAAAVYAQAAANSGKDGPADHYAARAVALLRLALKHGYKDFAHLQKDSDFQGLRTRSDYLSLLKEARQPK